MDDEADLSPRMQEVSSRDRAIQRVASWIVFVVMTVICTVILALQGKL